MELATIGGVIVVFAAVFASLIMEGASPTSIVLIPPIILVFVGSIGAAVSGGYLSDVMVIFKQLMKAFTAKAPKSDEAVAELIALADIARREGLLALEERARSAEDPFLREGLEMTVDGTDADEIYDVLAARIKTRKKTDHLGIKFFADMGGYAPTIGIIGTVIGLIHVLSNLDKPEELGHLIAGAFVATLWGVMSANVLWLPFSSKLKRISEAEVAHLEMVLEGVMSIQAGTSPRVVEKRLRAVIAGGAPLEDAA